ncbi:9094_t:CDS:1 [Gigaspora margarita]|uniref:9094_t:CDS:1 n=1 Tax=Gigaspora margarita TaxID=4874 RepID=A0ABN7V8J2_GIGMA|nr:9094_t:CDS:1 [Gigaspora margarita]
MNIQEWISNITAEYTDEMFIPLTPPPSRHYEESDATYSSIIRSAITKRNFTIDQAKEDDVITDVLGPNTNCDVYDSDAMSVSTVISSNHSFRDAHCYHNTTTSIPSSDKAIIEWRQDTIHSDSFLHEPLYDFNRTLSPEVRQMNCPLYNFNHLSPQRTMKTDGSYYGFNHQLPQVNVYNYTSCNPDNPPLSGSIRTNCVTYILPTSVKTTIFLGGSVNISLNR